MTKTNSTKGKLKMKKIITITLLSIAPLFVFAGVTPNWANPTNTFEAKTMELKYDQFQGGLIYN
jgi:hypothetical protein